MYKSKGVRGFLDAFHQDVSQFCVACLPWLQPVSFVCDATHTTAVGC